MQDFIQRSRGVRYLEVLLHWNIKENSYVYSSRYIKDNTGIRDINADNFS